MNRRGIEDLLEALRSGDGALRVNVGETATKHWSGDSRDTTSEGTSESDIKHWWMWEEESRGSVLSIPRRLNSV